MNRSQTLAGAPVQTPVRGTGGLSPKAATINRPAELIGLREFARDVYRRFRGEHAAFLLACAYLVFEYNRPQGIWPVLQVIPWAQSLVLLSLLLASRDPHSRKPPASVVVPMTLFGLSVVLSTALAYQPATAFAEWITFFNWYVIVLVLSCVVTTRQRLLLFLLVYYLVNLKMAQHGFRSWAFRGFSFSGWGVTGSPGWFQNSGEFGMQMAMFLPIVIAHVAVIRRHLAKSVRLLVYATGIMAAGSIIASNSRGGMLGLAAVGLWAIGFARHRFRALAVVALAVVAVLAVMPDEFKARFAMAGEDDTSVSRLTYWQKGLEIVAEHPVTGVGFRNWQVYVRGEHPELIGVVKFGTVEVIHNTYLEAATELGVTGLIVYAIILIQIFVTNRRTARRASWSDDDLISATAKGLNGSLLAMLVCSTFMSVLYYPFIWILLTLTVCTALVARNTEPRSWASRYDRKTSRMGRGSVGP